MIRNGDIDTYETGDQGIVSYIRMTEDESMLVLINLTGETQTLELAPSEKYGEFTSIYFQNSDDTESRLEGNNFQIRPYGMLVLE